MMKVRKIKLIIANIFMLFRNLGIAIKNVFLRGEDILKLINNLGHYLLCDGCCEY